MESQAVFQAKTQAKIFLLNWVPVAEFHVPLHAGEGVNLAHVLAAAGADLVELDVLLVHVLVPAHEHREYLSAVGTDHRGRGPVNELGGYSVVS